MKQTAVQEPWGNIEERNFVGYVLVGNTRLLSEWRMSFDERSFPITALKPRRLAHCFAKITSYSNVLVRSTTESDCLCREVSAILSRECARAGKHWIEARKQKNVIKIPSDFLEVTTLTCAFRLALTCILLYFYRISNLEKFQVFFRSLTKFSKTQKEVHWIFILQNLWLKKRKST